MSVTSSTSSTARSGTTIRRSLAFINSGWHEDWAGELILYPDGTASHALCVGRRPGRMALFDGMIRHRGGAPGTIAGAMTSPAPFA